MDYATALKDLNIIALVAMMLSIGLKVTWGELAASATRIRPLAIGLLTNFAVVPLATAALLQQFQPASFVSAGFLILAVCPGAPVGPPLVATARGDVPLATSLMVILVAASAVIAPLVLNIILPWQLPAAELQFDVRAIVQTLLLTQLMPLAIGLAIHRWVQSWADRAVQPLAQFANVLLLVVIGMILATQFELLATIRLRGWLGMTVLLAISLAAGWVGGLPNIATQRALAVTTGLRNAAVGLVIVNENFADTPAVTAVVAYSLLSILGTMLFAVVVGRFAKAG